MACDGDAPTTPRTRSQIRQRTPVPPPLDPPHLRSSYVYTHTRTCTQAELPVFRDIAGLKAAADASKNTLVAAVMEHQRRREALRPQLAALRAELADRRAALLRDPQAAALEAADAKLRSAEQNVFTLREFVAARARDADYSGLKADVVRLTGEVNLLLQRAQRGLAGGGSGGGGYGGFAGGGGGGGYLQRG